MKTNIWLRIVGYFKPFIGLLAGSLALVLVVIVADLANPYISKLIIDDYITIPDSTQNIWLLGGAYFGAVLLGAAALYGEAYLLNSMGQRIVHKIRVEIFSHIQKMSLKYFDTHASGSILTRVTNDIEALSELYSGVIVDTIKDFFMIIGIVAAMLLLNWKIALICMTIVPLIVVITIFYNRKAKANFRHVRSLIGAINAFFAENLAGMKLVQIFSRQKEKFGEFLKLNDEYNDATILGVKLNAMFRPMSEFINSLAISLLIWACAPEIFKGALEIGTLSAFITYSKKFFSPISDLADKYSTIQSGSVSAERIFELMDSDEYVESLDAGRELPDVRGEIEFRNVWFSYSLPDENGSYNWVLKNVSFIIKAGQTVAFAGATGSGKSTIINLIGRFYTVQKGEILLDGVNINEYKLSSLRKAIAVVMQDVFLFAGDIKSNIRLNNASITDEEVIEASKYVNSDDFIRELPNGYDEEVQERGVTLSSGQRQLLSFARAIAFKPKILVLDEATSNIDTEHEIIIQDSLEKISKDRTTIVIAHRLSTIKDSDVIFVIHKGRVAESGTHDELLVKDGIYRKLYEIQFA